MRLFCMCILFCTIMSNLLHLYLDDNNFLFVDDIMRSMAAFPSLRFLSLDYSFNKGGILFANEVPDLPYLEVLALRNNDLNGTLPMEAFASFHHLKVLDLSYNNFVGSIPSTIKLLSSLEVISFDRNELNGSLPEDHGSFSFSLFSNHTRLKFFQFERDNEKFEVETEEPIGWIPLFQLKYLLLSNWNIKTAKGSVVPSFLLHQHDLRTLDLAHNSLEGQFPNWLLKNNKKLNRLVLRNDSFQGVIRDALYKNASIRWLDISKNNMTGTIPEDIQKFIPNIEVLNFSSNALNGVIPFSIRDLSELSTLDLSDNELSGEVPKAFFTNLSRFAVIKLSNNRLSGYVLSGNLSFSIQVLQLDNNNFIGDIGNNTNKDWHRAVLDISNNHFTGEIPEELGMLTHILFLNLSHNRLTGPIPVSFSNLAKIESLDLSSNRLSGNVPSQLVKLTYLEVFNVSHNNLSGRLPDWKAQFATFTMESYEGNPLLCGLPLENKCTTAPHVSDSSTNEGTHKWYDIDRASFYGSSGSTWFVFMLGFAAILYINPYWRRWWLDFVEECMYICYYSFMIL
ncbi:hypothetical protein L1987_30782 [Smallanthus sonchifolius]|uniref:Uncharacterized protein n=1 Tax=Smallanthus sonchifolius TaxID=185202 RepID=A0ACB9I3J5_9ASTR|nr:hypothetical protein L1987_30782 [Smallanthus sonchifolius]